MPALTTKYDTPITKHYGDRLADGCYLSITYKHHISGIEVMLLEATDDNPLTRYLGDDYYDQDPVSQAFNCLWGYIQFEHPEYKASQGYHALVFNPQPLIDERAAYGKDYTIYKNGEDIRRDKSTERLFCNAFQLDVGDKVLVGWLGKNPYKERISTSEASLMCTKYSQGYYRYRIIEGAKRRAFERNPEAVARWSDGYGGWLWCGYCK